MTGRESRRTCKALAYHAYDPWIISYNP